MDRYEKLVTTTLKEHGAVLERQRKHAIWRLPDNSIWVTPQTASDQCSWQNNWKDLQTRLGLKREKGSGVRREKKQKSVKPLVRAVLSKTMPKRVGNIRDVLMSVVKRPKPVYVECFAHEREVVLRTCVTVWLGRIFR